MVAVVYLLGHTLNVIVSQVLLEYFVKLMFVRVVKPRAHAADNMAALNVIV